MQTNLNLFLKASQVIEVGFSTHKRMAVMMIMMATQSTIAIYIFVYCKSDDIIGFTIREPHQRTNN